MPAKKSNKSAKSNKSDVSKQKTNDFAILSLIFGIVFFVPFASIGAVVFGFIALHQIKKSNEKGRKLAIAGIILGFFWILLFLLLIILFVLIFSSIFFGILSGMAQ